MERTFGLIEIVTFALTAKAKNSHFDIFFCRILTAKRSRPLHHAANVYAICKFRRQTGPYPRTSRRISQEDSSCNKEKVDGFAPIFLESSLGGIYI